MTTDKSSPGKSGPGIDIPGPNSTLRTLRQSQQVVWLFAVRFSLQIVAARWTTSDNDVHPVAGGTLDIERPFSIPDSLDGFVLSQLPARSVRVHATNVFDPLVWIVAVTLVYAIDSYLSCHFKSPFEVVLASTNQSASWISHLMWKPLSDRLLMKPRALGLGSSLPGDWFHRPCRTQTDTAQRFWRSSSSYLT